MKRTFVSTKNCVRRTYTQPTISVCRLKGEPSLLTGSSENSTMTIVKDNEEKWPVDPDTGLPYSPW
ncbi:MAG: hypothetical protein IJ832_04070 [Bacteroidaceae bacterium]|nr:hypothetical protein [Bacteroidaceae bacterium]